MRAPFQSLFEKMGQFAYGPNFKAMPTPPMPTPAPPTFASQPKDIGAGVPVQSPKTTEVAAQPQSLGKVTSQPTPAGGGLKPVSAQSQQQTASMPKPKPGFSAVPPGGFQ
jgi:hypothetical protein